MCLSITPVGLETRRPSTSSTTYAEVLDDPSQDSKAVGYVDNMPLSFRRDPYVASRAELGARMRLVRLAFVVECRLQPMSVM